MSNILRRRIAFGPLADAPAPDLAELYQEGSKLQRLPGEDAAVAEDLSLAEIQSMAASHKQYPRSQTTLLPESPSEARPGFDEVIESRRTIREFSNAPLALRKLAKVLHQTYGVTGRASAAGTPQLLRTAPSAGALYPGELYLSVRSVTDVRPGLYHYNVATRALELLRNGDPTDHMHRIFPWQDAALRAAVVVMVAAVFDRTKRKYGVRGYRYALLEIGHLAQNLYLACTALSLAVMTSGAFFDDEANRLLRLDGVDESVVYLAFVGERPSQPAGGSDGRFALVRDGRRDVPEGAGVACGRGVRPRKSGGTDGRG